MGTGLESETHIFWIEDKVFEDQIPRPFSLNSTGKKEIKHGQGCRCGLCSQQFEEHDLFIHHIQPKAHGGLDRKENLVALCEPCHRITDVLALNESVYFGTEEYLERVVFLQPQAKPSDSY